MKNPGVDECLIVRCLQTMQVKWSSVTPAGVIVDDVALTGDLRQCHATISTLKSRKFLLFKTNYAAYMHQMEYVSEDMQPLNMFGGAGFVLSEEGDEVVLRVVPTQKAIQVLAPRPSYDLKHVDHVVEPLCQGRRPGS